MSARGSRRPEQLTPSWSLLRAGTLSDFNLLTVVLQPAWHSVTWGCFLKIQSPKSYSADSVRSEIKPRNLFQGSLVTWMELGQRQMR